MLNYEVTQEELDKHSSLDYVYFKFEIISQTDTRFRTSSLFSMLEVPTESMQFDSSTDIILSDSSIYEILSNYKLDQVFKVENLSAEKSKFFIVLDSFFGNIGIKDREDIEDFIHSFSLTLTTIDSTLSFEEVLNEVSFKEPYFQDEKEQTVNLVRPHQPLRVESAYLFISKIANLRAKRSNITISEETVLVSFIPNPESKELKINGGFLMKENSNTTLIVSKKQIFNSTNPSDEFTLIDSSTLSDFNNDAFKETIMVWDKSEKYIYVCSKSMTFGLLPINAKIQPAMIH